MPTPNAVALLGLLCAVACGCRTPPEAGQSRQPAENGGASLDARVGWVHGSCLAIANGMLAADAPLVIVRPGGAAPIDDARVVGLTASDTICPALLEGRRATNAQDGWSFYEITTASAARVPSAIARQDP